MTPASAQFDQLLERYVFKVTSHQIELADPATQTALIDFWQTASEAAVSADQATGQASPQPTEWATVLQQPVDWRSVNRRWVQELIRERGQCHSKYMVRLEQAVKTTQMHLQMLQNSPFSGASRTRIAAHYGHLLLMYERQLTRAQHIQQVYFGHLNADTP